MGWGETVLIFQAFITLIIGVIFFLQVIDIDPADLEKLDMEITSPNVFDEESKTIIINLKERYTKAAYILMAISII